jgi:uncharacterized membrane protein
MKTRPEKDHGSALWLVPVSCVLIGLLISVVTIAVDRLFDYDLVPRAITGGPDSALQILSTIAASMVSLAALVLTITMVVVQLAMGQFSPRIVQRILRDKPSQITIGVFVATFAHAMLAMREVKFEPEETVPGFAIIIAYLLVFTSIVLLIIYVNHIGQALRVSALIELVGTDTRALLDRIYPQDRSDTDTDRTVVTARESGVVVGVAHQDLVELAVDEDCTLELVPAIGQFVPAGAPLLRARGTQEFRRGDDAVNAVKLGLERTLEHDPAYGLRLLVDIAERCVSESPYQDPTTAVQAIDRLHDCLRQLAPRSFPDGRHCDRHGTVRLVVPTMDWDAYVQLAFEEIRLAGTRSPQVTRRLEAALRDLLVVAPADRRPPLRRELELLETQVAEQRSAEHDRIFALEPDPEGIGPRPARRA